jgi:hypothetical protein
MRGQPFLKLGLVLVLFGLALVSLVLLLPHTGRYLGWLGRLPGDINLERGGTRVYVPLASSIILSILLTLVLNLLLRR